MTKAETLEKSQKVPAELKEAADHVSEVAKNAYTALENAPENSRLRTTHENHGLHAYRYEILDDDSCIVLYANDEKGDVKIKAFSNIEEASQWTPRALRNGSE